MIAETPVEQLFLDYFASQGLATEPTAFDGRSDYGPFIEAGIPAGGLFTGAEGIKTEEQAAVFGGTAGEQYDPCYHLGCDDIRNLSLTALDQMSDAAHVTITLAHSETRPGAAASDRHRRTPVRVRRRRVPTRSGRCGTRCRCRPGLDRVGPGRCPSRRRRWPGSGPPGSDPDEPARGLIYAEQLVCHMRSPHHQRICAW